jgi:signal transduction histidine kinase
MASHEFRTPLSSILSSASLLSKYTESEQQDKRDRHIARIKDAVKNLNDILEDFLSLGKLDEGKVSVDPAPFNLQEFLEDTIDNHKGLLKNGQQIVYDHRGNAEMHTDKKLLKNILINLISNAIKFSDEAGTITVTSEVVDGEAKISVEDQGLGISDEDKEHLFSSFFRGRNAINIQGTGLGLHIVKRYLDLLKGEVDLKSKLGEGTTISVTIPVNLTTNGKENTGY